METEMHRSAAGQPIAIKGSPKDVPTIYADGMYTAFFTEYAAKITFYEQTSIGGEGPEGRPVVTLAIPIVSLKQLRDVIDQAIQSAATVNNAGSEK